MKKKIILASSSPRRHEILTKMGLEFEVIPSFIDEELDNSIFEYGKIEKIAFDKAVSVSKKINNPAIVIGADTVVVLNGEILGKPKNITESKAMLKSLSGNTHLVVTSICIINSKTAEKKISSVTSEVEFEQLTEEQIEEYISVYKPLDKAGAYGIQEMPKGFIKNVSGSYENVIGLCPKELSDMLRDF